MQALKPLSCFFRGTGYKHLSAYMRKAKFLAICRAFQSYDSMKLIIVRHGEAHPGTDDFNRELTDKGRNDVAAMARLLGATNWKVTEICSSPLVRAKQTASIICETLKSKLSLSVREDQRLAPGLDFTQINDMIHPETPSCAVVWVFHSPDVIRLSSFLTGVGETCFYFPPGGMLALNVPPSINNCKAMIIWNMQPEYLNAFSSL
jgi:phosphohistidine phosphatase